MRAADDDPSGSWAWVGDAWGRHRELQRETVRGAIAGTRAAAASVQEGCARAQRAVDEGVAAARAGVRERSRRAYAEACRRWRQYPECAVVGTTLFLCNCRGAANGTMLGAAPKRAALTMLALSALASEPLAAKWGDAAGRASGALSETVRACCDAAGVLPAPRPSEQQPASGQPE